MEEVSQEEIEKACADANILGFINSLPDGFETKVGGKGSQLSGGQKRKFHFRLETSSGYDIM
jgi:ATP-binding cassette subfamily B (MDR/TAP) protein 1